MFTSLATLRSIVTSVQNGGLTDDQKSIFELGPSAGSGNVDSDMTEKNKENNAVPVVEMRSEPCCPWFTCCY